MRCGSGRNNKLLKHSGLSTIEGVLLFSVIVVISVVTLPRVTGHLKGNLIFGAVRNLDRQFDPNDRSSDDQSNNSTIGYRRVALGGMPRASLYSPTSELTNVGSLTMGLIDLPSGAIPGESAGSESVNTSGGGFSSDYSYCDEMLGGCPDASGF